MVRSNKSRNNGRSSLFGTTIGTGICLLLWIACSAVAACLVSSEQFLESSMKWMIPSMQLVISFCGTYVAGKVSSEKKVIASLICAFAYIALLLISTVLLFDSELYGCALIVGTILGGTFLAILLNYYTSRRPAGRKHLKTRKFIVQH